MRRFLLPLAVFIVLVGFLAVGLRLNPREVPSPLIGKQVPAFRLAQLHAGDKTIGPEDLRGQVWLLNVWAPWCVSCLQEHKFLMALAQSRQAPPLVGLNWKDRNRDAQRLLARTGNPYVAVPDDPSGRAGIDWGVTGTPETYLIDRAGIVRLKHVGPIDPQVWQSKFVPKLRELGA